MARQRTRFHDTIEYIGARPQKPKRRNFFGGWVIIVIAIAAGYWFGKPLMPFLKASQTEVSAEQADALISALKNSKKIGDRVAAGALGQAASSVAYDPAYYKMTYPGGDVPVNKGVAADVVVRAFRSVNIDFQALVHEDMVENFRRYPQLWSATEPDANIDHRRVPNLQRFFEREGQSLEPSRNAADYLPGDVIIWSLANAESHIGIIVPSPTNREGEVWAVHHLGTAGVKWENCLFDYSIQKHFRFPLSEKE